MRAIVLVSFAALLPLALPARAAGAADRFTGVARGADGAVLYVEDHEVQRDGARLASARTVYRDPAGRILAVLRTDFSEDPFAPSYVFEVRGAPLEAVARTAAGLELREGDRKRAIPGPRDPARRLVAGQGLDRLVRERLPELASGTRVELAYAIPSRLDAFDLRVRALGGGGSTVRVRAEFSSWVLRLLAPTLEVEYDRETRRLLRYRGVSNLTFDGTNPEVEITYAYATEEVPRAAP